MCELPNQTRLGVGGRGLKVTGAKTERQAADCVIFRCMNRESSRSLTPVFKITCESQISSIINSNHLSPTIIKSKMINSITQSCIHSKPYKELYLLALTGSFQQESQNKRSVHTVRDKHDTKIAYNFANR